MHNHLKPILAAMIVLALPVEARITRIVVEHRDASAYKGLSFKDAGAYERLSGHAYGEIDPKDPLNAIITDLQYAPRNVRGMVEYVATFSMAKPADLAKASGVLVYLVPNRGNISLETTNVLVRDFLNHGHVVLASGWQGDLQPREGLETISVPIARNPDGSSITGPALARFADMPPNTNTLPIVRGRLAQGGGGQPASLDTSKALLTRRASQDSKVVPIRASDWAFADCTKTAFPGTPDPNRVCLKNGFEPAYLYELSYTAKDPQVLGIGFAATRDLISFFHYSVEDDTGSPNLLARRISYTVGQGNSQSGNFLRTLINLGFTQDESGRRVLDGANPNIAARQLAMNFRFAAPGGAAGMYEPGSDGVVWWSDYTDEVRHRPNGGLLDRCRASETCPKIIETMGASEFYALRASPDFVGTKADRDIPLPPTVRRYYFPGVTHGGGRGGFDANAPRPPMGCELPANPNPSTETMRALLGALVDWVVKGTAPPPSQYPRLDRGDLVAPMHTATGFPAIPGMPLPDGILNPLYDYDFGPHFNYNDQSGFISMQPPVVRAILPSLVPRVDADGNETAGVASVMHQAPLGTYLGWNVVADGFFKGTSCGNLGGYIPFAKTKAERTASGDPRPSLEERYGTHEKYVATVRAAAGRMVRDRFLVPEDADRLIAEADASNVLK
jgi:alpha/beta hydrolase family protein